MFFSNNFVLNRRHLLISGGTLLGASALRSNPSFSQAGSTRWPTPEGSFGKKMIGYMLAHEEFSVPELVELGVAAEKAGFDLLATSDHLQPWQSNEGHSGEAWVTMGALTQRTEHVWIGPTVTCPTLRYNPAVVAEAYASLSLLAPGRVFLGIGSGEALNEEAATGMWPKWQERSERLIEAAGIIRKLWTGQPLQQRGKYYSVDAKLFDPPAQPIPLLMAANGPKAMRRAGQYGDGLITDPKTWKNHKDQFVAAARAAGKDLNRMPVLVEQYVVVGGKKDAEEAAELWRFGPKAFETYYNIRSPQEIQAEAQEQIPLEKVYAEWPVSTDPAAHIKKIAELFDSGVTIVNVHAGQKDQKRVIEFYAKEVLPQVRGMRSAA